VRRLRLPTALLVAIVVLPALVGLGCHSVAGTEQIGLVWSDEFDGELGESPDSTRWTYDIGTGVNGWGNAQLEYDTDHPDNVSLDGEGNLAITAIEESYMGSDYTSARIKTEGLFQHAYGRFEARIKLPVGQGIWPAFWLLGSDIGTVGWPDCGEIDIMEYLGHQPNRVYGTLHGPDYSGGSSVGGSYTLPDGAFNDDFHVFAIDWDLDSVTWSVDGQDYMTITSSDIPSGEEWVFDHDFFIILNVAVGGYWPGSPDATTEFPQTMLVDYVRVYGTVS
jgi:beta-glucanase (GH16 family)